MTALPGIVFLIVDFFPFHHLNCIMPLLACRISVEKSTGGLMGIPLWITNYFSLSSFKFLSFIFNIFHFNHNESWCESLFPASGYLSPFSS